MKKRLLASLLCLCMVASICACSKNSTEVDTEKKTKEEETKQEPEESPAPVIDEPQTSSTNEGDMFIWDAQSGQVFVLNVDNDDFSVIDTKEIVASEIKDIHANLVDANKYCQAFTLHDENDSNNDSVYSNLVDMGCQLVMDGLYMPKVGVVGDDICIDTSVYDENGLHYECYECHLMSDGTYYAEPVCEEILNIVNNTGGFTASRYYGNRESYGMAYCARKYGIVPVCNANYITFYDISGNYLDKILAPGEKDIELAAFDGEYVVCEMDSENYYPERIFAYDFGTGETIEVNAILDADYHKSLHTLDLKDGMLYYAITDFPQNSSLRSCDIHSYDLKNKKDAVIKRVSTVIGHDYLSDPGLFGFKAIGDSVYFLDESDADTCWFKSTYDGTKWSEAKATDMCAKHYGFADFGKIVTQDDSMKCPYCEKNAYFMHNEYMEFDNRVGNFEKINEIIKNRADREFENAQSFEVLYSEEDCKDYLHGPNPYNDSSEESTSKIRDVRRVLDHYIYTSNYYYYYPIGAAHGWSTYENHLYDEETGEEVTFADIYTGGEERLKAIVADKILQVYDSGDIYFFSDDRNEIYQQVYDEVNINFEPISFYDDHVTFDFMPYDLAPYSEGIISLPVSYDELFGTKTVSKADKPYETYDMDFVDVFGEHYTATINKSLPMHPYDTAKIKNNDGKYSYEDDKYTSVLGIDASKYQGLINFDTVADEGYEFAYLRLGYRGYGKDGTIALDNAFEQNFVAAIDAGLDVGVYFFSQAINEAEAQDEALFVVCELADMKKKYGDKYVITLPIVYDPESILDKEARTDNISASQFTKNVHAFFELIDQYGYEDMLYCNMLWQIFNLETDDIFNGDIRVWYADYEPLPQTPYMFEMWQYTNEAKVPGVKGAVDVNIWFKEK